MQIDINDQTGNLTKDHVELLQNVLKFAGKKEHVLQNIEASVTIVKNEQIKSLNAQYRNMDEATDVLSFEMDNPFRKQNIEQLIPIMIGDIIISHDKVIEQSSRYNHSFERELAFLALHGFLHLLGYTHDNKEKETEMFQKQEAILEEFNLERP